MSLKLKHTKVGCDRSCASKSISMNSEEQLSLFDNPTAPVSQPDLIPTDAKIPILPGTYSDMTELAQH